MQNELKMRVETMLAAIQAGGDEQMLRWLLVAFETHRDFGGNYTPAEHFLGNLFDHVAMGFPLTPERVDLHLEEFRSDFADMLAHAPTFAQRYAAAPVQDGEVRV